MSQDKTIFVTIPNKGELELNNLLEKLKYLKQGDWIHQKYKASPALANKSMGSTCQYTGQQYDPEKFEMVKDGWTHDHCDICFQKISSIPDQGDPNGYTRDNNDWICNDCYELFMRSPDINETIKSLKLTTQ